MFDDDHSGTIEWKEFGKLAAHVRLQVGPSITTTRRCDAFCS